MAEMPQAPEQDAPAGQNSGGGVAEALVQADAMLAKIAKATSAAEQVPEEAKAAFATALEAFRGGLEIVMEAARGGGRAQPSGAAAPEAGGAPGAVPVSPAGVQR